MHDLINLYNTILQSLKVLGLVRKSRHLNYFWWLCPFLTTLKTFLNKIRFWFSCKILFFAWFHWIKIPSWNNFQYFGYSFSNFQDSVFDWIENFVSFDSSSWKFLVFSSFFKCIYFMNEERNEDDHFKDYHWMKYAYLLDFFYIISSLFFL